MIQRHILPILVARAAQWSVVTVTGPRQSGKTTLCRQAFPDKPYANLERPDTRDFARTDPRAFLKQFPDGAVIDEIQRVPELLSWIQVAVDENNTAGQFILTGSHQFELSRHISQSLAGRTALLKLLPLSIAELLPVLAQPSVDTFLYQGGYPRIHAQHLDPAVALGDYFETYVQRDLRELVQLRNLHLFEKFVRLVAGRVGQLVNMQSLAADVGISGNTVQEWLTLLETSYIVFRLPPWSSNMGKRLIKSPKLYFYDVGLAAWLMGITQPAYLPTHPLRGNLFENLVILEVLKTLHNAGVKPNLCFYRDASHHEADLLLETGDKLHLLEIKSAQTLASDAMHAATKVKAVLGERVASMTLVYGGEEAQQRSAFAVLPYTHVQNWVKGVL